MPKPGKGCCTEDLDCLACPAVQHPALCQQPLAQLLEVLGHASNNSLVSGCHVAAPGPSQTLSQQTDAALLCPLFRLQPSQSNKMLSSGLAIPPAPMVCPLDNTFLFQPAVTKSNHHPQSLTALNIPTSTPMFQAIQI